MGTHMHTFCYELLASLRNYVLGTFYSYLESSNAKAIDLFKYDCKWLAQKAFNFYN